jgi:hypothetical protein
MHASRGAPPPCAPASAPLCARHGAKIDPGACRDHRRRAFSGYASVFAVVDRRKDPIPARGLSELARRAARRACGRARAQHDPNEPIGAWRTIREDARGLNVLRVCFRPALTVAREVLADEIRRAGRAFQASRRRRREPTPRPGCPYPGSGSGKFPS